MFTAVEPETLTVGADTCACELALTCTVGAVTVTWLPATSTVTVPASLRS